MGLQRNLRDGFTLIELLIVITLIGILAAGLITLINPLEQMKRARDVERKSDLIQIQTALELFRADNSTYPTVAMLPSGCNSQFSYNGTVYLKSFPCDPVGTNVKYTYTPANGNLTYTLSACLENSKDTGIVTGNTSCNPRFYYQVTNP